jgi:hypothetical protein
MKKITRGLAWFTLVCVFVGVVWGVYPVYLHFRKQRPSLAETQQWLANTFSDGVFEATGRDSKITFNGCRAVITGSTEFRYVEQTNHTTVPSTDSFNLGDLDPNNISVDNTANGSIDNTAKNPAVVVNLPVNGRGGRVTEVLQLPARPNSTPTPKPDSSESDPTYYYALRLSVAPEYAPRFIKAMRHAVELCGGKPSVF